MSDLQKIRVSFTRVELADLCKAIGVKIADADDKLVISKKLMDEKKLGYWDVRTLMKTDVWKVPVEDQRKKTVEGKPAKETVKVEPEIAVTPADEPIEDTPVEIADEFSEMTEDDLAEIQETLNEVNKPAQAAAAPKNIKKDKKDKKKKK